MTNNFHQNGSSETTLMISSSYGHTEIVDPLSQYVHMNSLMVRKYLNVLLLPVTTYSGAGAHSSELQQFF